jgi:hypothetical protein
MRIRAATARSEQRAANSKQESRFAIRFSDFESGF